MDAKILTLEYQCNKPGVAEKLLARREVIRLFNPLLGPGVLSVETVSGEEYEIDCILAESLPLPSEEFVGVGSYATRVRLKSHGIPAFRDPTINVHTFDFVGSPGNFFFPWSFPRVFAQSGFANNPTINNEGDIDTPVRIELTGPFIDPVLTNSTSGRTISMVGLTVLDGQTLVIDTDPNNYVVQVDGTDVWNYLGSANFWGLGIGDNQLVIDIGGTTVDTVGSIQWYTRYLGI
jgi:hypothetical protein